MSEILDKEQWRQNGKDTASELRASARSAAREMFSSGDIREYLDIISRITCYDAYNLILILKQYPKAKFLAGYKVWENLQQASKPNTRVLRPEWVGKGIDLAMPFIDVLGAGEHRLVWFAARVFDISQTNVKYDMPPKVYTPDEKHLSVLIESACKTISMEYGRTVYHIGSDAAMKAAGLPGKMSEITISIRDDMRPEAKLDWLIDCLCALQGSEKNLPQACQDLFRQCVKHTLWKTWSLEHPPSLYAYRNKIRGLSEEIQMDFLDHLRRTVRSLEESVAAAYADRREELESEAALHELDQEILNTDLRPPI